MFIEILQSLPFCCLNDVLFVMGLNVLQYTLNIINVILIQRLENKIAV